MKLFILSLTIILAFLNQSHAQNHPPVAVNDTVYAFPGDTILLHLLKNDYDPDGDSISVIFVPPGVTKINDSTWSRPYFAAVDYSTQPGAISYNISDKWGAMSTGKVVLFNKAPYTYEMLDINNLTGVISPFGFHFDDFEGKSLEVPKNSGKYMGSVLNFWMGGYPESSYLRLAAERTRQVGADFFAGPISTNSDTNFMRRWQRVYKLNKTDIQYHINNWSNANYKPIETIANWPAQGDVAHGETPNLAPYFDTDHNGIYEPMLGDYPIIRGDQAIFFVFNDSLHLHTSSQGQILGIEIAGMAYAYDKPDDSTLFNTIFFHYDVTNKSLRKYHDTYMSLYADFDIGYYLDDYIMTDVTNGMVITYNSSPVDGDGTGTTYGEHPPAIGLKVIGGAFLPADGIDNPSGLCDYGINGLNFGDNIIDNERMGLTHSNFSPKATPWQQPMATDFYEAMKSTTLNYGCSTPYTPGGTGPLSRYIFPGDSDTLCNWSTSGVLPNGGFNQNGYYWDEQTLNNPNNFRNSVATVGSITFDPSETIPLDWCIMWARDYDGDHMASVKLLRDRMTQLSPQLSMLTKIPATYLNVTSSQTPNMLIVVPNPATDLIAVTSKWNKTLPYTIYTFHGVAIMKGQLLPGTTEISLSNLPKGVYLIHSEAGFAKIVKL